MTLHTQLERILKEEVCQVSADMDDRILLQEKAAKMRVEVVGLSAPITTIRMGRKLNHLSALKDGPLKRICDYLLIVQMKDTYHAIFIELKKTLSQEEDPAEQLLRSRPLLEYLLSVCDIEDSKSVLRPEMNYVVVYEKINLNKPHMIPNLSGKIDEIQYKSINIKRFQGTRVILNDLVGG